MSIVHWKQENSIAVIEINNPPINALAQTVRQGIIDALDQITLKRDIQAVLITCAGRTFCAGADITEFSKPPQAPRFNEVIGHIENFHLPVIACLHGTVLGGGLELALGCHYRVALEGTKFGFPEVKLGLIPGAGGTQRLPRVSGLSTSIEMITGGKPIETEIALKEGLIDESFPDDLLGSSLKFAEHIISSGAPLLKTSDRPFVDQDYDTILERSKDNVLKKARGVEAPVQALDAISEGAYKGFETGLEVESALFTKLKASPQSKALRHVFFAERQTSKLPYLKDIKPCQTFKSVGVIGAGTMGCGIAMAMSNAGLTVVVIDKSVDQLAKAKLYIETTYAGQVQKGRLSSDEKSQRLNNISFYCELGAVADLDLIIEAVFESMDVKRSVFTELDKVAKADAVLATNTSYLDVNEIASFTSCSQRVLGMHFFSPAHVMKLLEIVRADQTSLEVLASVIKFAKTIQKIGVVSGVCYGFIGNRMLQGYMREAGLMLLEGALPQQIDQALVEFGMPMGVFSMLDMAGLDIGSANRKNMQADQYDPKAFEVIEALVSEGRFGQKTGAGIYLYPDGARKGDIDPYVTSLIEKKSKDLGFSRRDLSNDEIVQRCIYALVNEAAHILDENIASQASDIDVVYVNGYGFPAYKGGPLFYADQIGLSSVLKTIETFKDSHGPKWWTPAPYLVRLVNEGGLFHG